MRTLFVDEHHHHDYLDDGILKVENFLSEFDTDIKKAIVRSNLGITDSGSGYNQEEIDTAISSVKTDIQLLEEGIQEKINTETAAREEAFNILDIKIKELNPDTNGGGASLLWVTNNFQPIGNYLTEGDITDFITESGLNDFKQTILEELDGTYLKTIPDEYITSDELSEALKNVGSSDIQDVLVNGESVVKNKLALIDLSEYALKSEIIKGVKVGDSEITPNDNGILEIPVISGGGSGLTATQISNLTTLDTWVKSGKGLSTVDFTQNDADSIHQHSNKSILDTITQDKINKWDSNSGTGLTDLLLEELNKISLLSAQISALQSENTNLKNLNSLFTIDIARISAEIEALKSGDTPPESIDVLTELKINNPLITITEGDSIPTISITGVYSESGEKSIPLADCTITSNDSSVATWENGIKVNKPGQAVLTFNYEGKSCYLALVIKELEVPVEVVLTSLTSSPQSITRTVGANPVTLAFTAHYSDNSSLPVTAVTCTSSDTTIAKWENNKVTIGNEEGSALLTFTYEGKSCLVAVNVSANIPTSIPQYVGYARTQNSVFQNSDCEKDTVEGTWNSGNTQWLDSSEPKHYLFIITTEDIKEIGAPGLGNYELSDINKGTITDDSGNVYTIYRIGPALDNSSEIFINLN